MAEQEASKSVRCPPSVLQLVDCFDQHKETYKHHGYGDASHGEPVLRGPAEVTERQIHQLVCELHALTDEEIRIVEEATEGSR
jgi:hypothetical protein